MNNDSLHAAAKRLQAVLATYSDADENVRRLEELISPLILAVVSGKVLSPLAWSDVPGGHLFAERYFALFPDLEDSFAKFKVEVTGGENEVIRLLRCAIEEERRKNNHDV